MSTSTSVRALRQLSSLARRQLCTGRTLAGRRVGSMCKGVGMKGVRAFSVSGGRFGQGASDPALIQTLQSELKYEAEAKAEQEAGIPEFLKVFNEQGLWQIEDAEGYDEVVLTRKFGNENIRLMFSIADLQSEEDMQSSETGEEGSEEPGDDAPYHAFPIRASLTITKTTGPGCISVDMVCQEGHFIVDNISYYKDAKLGTELTAEADWKRRGLYIGPQFDTLDVSVQEELEKYLQERGVDERVALFIPEYAEHKEQSEYVKWLENLKSFVEQ